jgi:hypothetical protein
VFSIELVNTYVFTNLKVYFLQLFHYVGRIIVFSIELVNTYVFKIFKVHYTTEINNKWKTQYCCLLYMIYNTLM